MFGSVRKRKSFGLNNLDPMALQEFYGEGCPHCVRMAPIIAEVERELGVTFEKIEVWDNDENARRLEEIDRGRCGGVPFFYNDVTGKFLCGAASKEEILALVHGDAA